MIKKQFGRKLKMLRQESNLTFSQAASRLGLSVADYEMIEQGENSVRLDFIVKAAEAFGITASELLEGVEDL